MLNRCRVYSSTQGSNPCLTAIFLLVFTKLLESPQLSSGVGFIGIKEGEPDLQGLVDSNIIVVQNCSEELSQLAPAP